VKLKGKSSDSIEDTCRVPKTYPFTVNVLARKKVTVTFKNVLHLKALRAFFPRLVLIFFPGFLRGKKSVATVVQDPLFLVFGLIRFT
jgi:hypothetical protein